MNKLVESFGLEIKKSGFLTEWSLFVEEGCEVEVLANTFMENLRSQNDAMRGAFVHLLSFMKPRSWNAFLEEATDLFEPEEKERFKKPKAKDTYEKLRLMCCLQVEDYYRQYIADTQSKAEEFAGKTQAEDMIPTAFSMQIREIVRDEVNRIQSVVLEETAKAAKKATEEALKKLRDEAGEGWKDGDKDEQ